MSSTSEKMSLLDLAMVTLFMLVVGPRFPALTALSMTLLVLEFFGLRFKIFGIIQFGCLVWFWVYSLCSIVILVHIAKQPLKG